MPGSSRRSLDDELIDRSLLRLNTVATAVGFGLLTGATLFVTTLVLALRDGPSAGPHLGLLGQYLPGYAVSVVGSVVGLVYGSVGGAAAGYLVSSIYNRLTR